MEISLAGYEIIEQIAQGQLCDVFLALRCKDNLKVVIKLVRVSDLKGTQRVIREQRLIQEISHSNIVKVLDTGCLGIRPYLILEYIEGESLREMIIKQAPLTIAATKKIISELASAVSVLHSHDIIHRDLKPENILLDSNGCVKLIDFSVSTKSYDQGVLTSHDKVVGTTDYMSPEQRTGADVDKQTDQYAMAAVAYEMLTGHFAIGQFRTPSDLNPTLDSSLDEVVLKGMEPFPEDRYADVTEFANKFCSLGIERLPDKDPAPKAEIPNDFDTAVKTQKSTPVKNRWAIPGGIGVLLILAAVVSYLKFVSLFNAPEQVASADSTMSGFNVGSNKIETISNSIGMEFVKIPSGQFEFGSSREQLETFFGKDLQPPFSTEFPVRKKQIFNPYWIGKSEVTVKQFHEFIEDSGYKTTSEKWAQEHGRRRVQPIWNDPVQYDIDDDKPVIAISWKDANEFCKWLSEREGKTYRLPTEVEWEYACRAGSRGSWSCSMNELGSHATFGRRWRTGPSRVCNNLPNAWGIHDMHGNVWEWCVDEYVVEPKTGVQRVSLDGKPGIRHVVRGGAYKAPPVTIRSSSRRGFSDYEPVTDRGHGIGFRVLLEVETSIQ